MALTDKQKQMYAAVEAVLAEQARAAEQGQQFTDDRVQTPSDELLMRYVENHLSVMGAFPNPPCNCRLHRALLAIGQPAQPPAGDRVREVLSEAKTATRELRQSESGDYALCVDCKRQMVFCKCPRPGRTVSNVASPIPAPAGDVVSRDSMQDLLEERDAQWEKAIREMFVDHPDSFGCMDIDEAISYVRARLAKPAEQTDEQKVADILNDSMLENSNDLSRRYLAKKIVAALKAGKQ